MLTVLGIVATKNWCIVMKIDVKGAFIQTPMKGVQTYKKLDEKMSKYVTEMYLKFRKLIHTDGCSYTALLKAMYGCV